MKKTNILISQIREALQSNIKDYHPLNYLISVQEQENEFRVEIIDNRIIFNPQTEKPKQHLTFFIGKNQADISAFLKFAA
jgi:nitrate/nitrite-specific signal transduction histidine kinase